MTFYEMNNVFKVNADQATNVKKGFENERECDQTDDIILLTVEMMEQQKKKDNFNKQEILKAQLEKEINEMNMVSDESSNKSKCKRDQVLDQLLEEIDYDYIDHNSEDDDSLLDADEDVYEVLDEMVDSFKSIDHISQLTR